MRTNLSTPLPLCAGPPKKVCKSCRALWVLFHCSLAEHLRERINDSASALIFFSRVVSGWILTRRRRSFGR